ncbi:uncharacterized protein LOC127870861 isoform X3 [Dreissena polymorpha]|nr:uncharacterized protein LOC127870861 isoform X2 [Dreissena polymorpha]XP_052269387.1 uncharacterized protein LOC127870861 isoform X3 [Dreissena polymorpha]
MGPSGAGKTTLLNTLNGRKQFSGSILVNGSPLNKAIKRNMCYVLQQEYFFGNLTLNDTLQFTAMIRLPEEMSRENKMARMNAVVKALQLEGCLGTIMGDMFTPGLSGGERKRANIACELLRDPAIIFLDEPTTGLDSSTSASLMSLLKAYAVQERKTVIASIHQPSSQIFFQFDKLLLLSGGQVAYFGLTENVVDHFQSVGVEIADDYNPADFILEALAESAEVREKLLHAANGSIRAGPIEKFSVTEQNNGKNLLDKVSEKFTKKKANTTEETSGMDPGSVRMSLLDLDNDLDAKDSVTNDNQKWPTGFWTQYSQLTIRTFKQSRSRILTVNKCAENLLVCAFVCLIFFQLPRTEDTLRDRMGAVFFIAAHWSFTPLFDAVTSFPMERMVINKERLAGWYRLSAYYLAKMTSELLLILIQPLVFVILAYWVINLNGIAAFFATLGTVMLNSVAGQSFGLFVGIACLQVNQAMTVSITFQMAIMLLGGLFTRNIPVFIDWMKYLSFLYYSFHSLMVLEFEHAQPVKCSSSSNSSVFLVCQETNVTSIPSHMVLEYYDITWSYWQYILPLLLFTVIFRVLGYITLRYFRKPF